MSTNIVRCEGAYFADGTISHLTEPPDDFYYHDNYWGLGFSAFLRINLQKLGKVFHKHPQSKNHNFQFNDVTGIICLLQIVCFIKSLHSPILLNEQYFQLTEVSSLTPLGRHHRKLNTEYLKKYGKYALVENCFIVIVLDSIIAFELHHSDANISQSSSHNRSWLHLSTCCSFSDLQNFFEFEEEEGGGELISMTGVVRTRININLEMREEDRKSEDPFSVPITPKDHNQFLTL